MNWLDLLLALLFFYCLFSGWRRGLIRQVFAVAGIIASYLAAIRFSSDFADWLEKILPLSKWLPQQFNSPVLPALSLGDIILYLLCFAIIFGLVSRLFEFAGAAAHEFFSLPVLGWVNGAGGMLLGAIKGAAIILIIVAAARLTGIPFLTAALKDSVLAEAIFLWLPVVYEQMIEVLAGKFA